MEIRTLCESWSKKTYQDGLKEMNICDDLLTQATALFQQLNILTIPMDGYSCEKLPKTEEARSGIQKTYSEIFHNEVERGYFSPASYLVQIIIEGNRCNSDDGKLVGAMARGLRTLTSLLREPDFAGSLKQVLSEYDPNVTTNLNSKQDSTDHTDVLLNYKGAEFRIWLYQFSARGLPHDIERLTGKRGELPNGIHLVCPLHTEVAIDYDSMRKKSIRLQSKLSDYQMRYQDCSPKAKKRKEGLAIQIDKITDELNGLLPKMDSEYKATVQELDVEYGWFFYSLPHIKRIAAYINSDPGKMQYSDVLELLTAPERFVGAINIFEKEG